MCVKWLKFKNVYKKPSFFQFATQYTSDMSGGRELMMSLSSIFKLIEDTKNDIKSISELTRGIALAFPSPTEAARLKKSLYTPFSDTLLDPMLIDKKEAELLLELITTPFIGCMNTQELSITYRTRSFWLQSRPEAKRLLLDTLELDHNSLFDEFLSATASVLSPEDILEISHSKPKLLPFFILSNPKLATSPQLWKTSVDVQREIFDVLKDSQGQQFY